MRSSERGYTGRADTITVSANAFMILIDRITEMAMKRTR